VAGAVVAAEGVRAGRYTDRHISVRQQRLVPLFVALASSAATFALLIALHSSSALLASVVAVLVAGVLTLASTTRWKISLHLVGITGAVTVLVLLFGPLALVLTPLVPLVGWARWQVRAHTVAQAVAGMALAVAIAIGTFWAFGIR
jgi:hypothetical protein